MKIKNLNIKKALKTTAVALVTGTVILTGSIGVAPTKVEASSYTYTNNVMYYFTSNVNSDIEKYLDKDESSTNLNKLLGYYDTLYDFINNNKYVQNTYFRNLTYAEQEELNYLLNSWGNRIYDMYSKKSYFPTSCKSKLGFTLKYDSQETGYDRDHDEVMEYYTETADEKLDTYLSEKNSESYLRKALNIYKELINFVKGSTRKEGYVIYELTQTEQADIIRLLENWTYDIENEYNGYSYYSSTCINRNYGPGWTVNIDNLYRELGEYINQSLNTQNPNFVQNNTGINYNHQAAITYFTTNQESLLNTYVTTINETNFVNSLNTYSTLWKFIKGEVSVYGYYYSNLTTTEKQTLINLMNNWTTKIANAYGTLENYNTLCTEKVGWTITLADFNRELTATNQTPVVNTPAVSQPIITPTNPVVPTPTNPVVSVPQQNINNTIGKDWRANYIDPSINTSRGVRDYVPENLDDLENNWNNQFNNGYYDMYGNYIPYNNNYNQFNGFNNYQEGYQEDYVPTYIPR